MKTVAVIGAGKLGERHVNAYLKVPGAKVLGVADVDDARLDAVCSRLGPDARRYHSLDEVLADDSVDVVDICTPTPLHFEQVTAALRAGKHVFCEKPLTRTLAEATALRDLLAVTPGTLRVGYVYRFHPRMQLLKQRLEGGALGDPYAAMLRIGGQGSHRAWKHQRDMAGGAVLDMATHMVDLAYWLFGAFDEIEPLHVALMVPKRRIDGELVEVDAEDVAVIRLRSRSGVHIVIHADFITPGFTNSVEVAGSDGSAFTSIVSAFPDRYVLREAADDLPAGEHVTAGADADMLTLEVGSFIADVEAGHFISDMDASLEVARVVEAVTNAF